MPLTERIRWARENFGADAVLLSSMQKTASILMYIFHLLNLDNEILFVDTQYHFQETLVLRDDFLRHYRLNLVTLYPENSPEKQERLYGRKLYTCIDGQPVCCRLRKEEPFLKYVRSRGVKLVMDGLRLSEGGKRGNLKMFEADPRFGGYRLHPLLDWTDEQVETWLKEHDVPVHPLYAKSYASIGCECCTTPVEPGEHQRAGRWRHLRDEADQGVQYCGMIFKEGEGI